MVVTAVMAQMDTDVVVKNITTKEVGESWRVADAWARVAKATATQVGCKGLLIPIWCK